MFHTLGTLDRSFFGSIIVMFSKPAIRSIPHSRKMSVAVGRRSVEQVGVATFRVDFCPPRRPSATASVGRRHGRGIRPDGPMADPDARSNSSGS